MSMPIVIWAHDLLIKEGRALTWMFPCVIDESYNGSVTPSEISLKRANALGMVSLLKYGKCGAKIVLDNGRQPITRQW